jgi:hypothetical protein
MIKLSSARNDSPQSEASARPSRSCDPLIVDRQDEAATPDTGDAELILRDRFSESPTLPGIHRVHVISKRFRLVEWQRIKYSRDKALIEIAGPVP